MRTLDKVTLRLDGKPYTVEADPHQFTAAELNAVERHTGMTVREWRDKLMDRGGSTLAWTALAWIAKRRAGEYVKWHDFEDDLKVLELLESVEFGSGEPEPPTG
ncbi:hypothetical protein [Pseudonocardia hispaniensis]|uniref:hypothetical protein n=1 Tax=Pseudonocardia hispaniensis TaxID=904933 RepID=UPI0036D24EA4